jgi:phosphoribosylformimino-5-aminoimidazole carboxamide ribotide isomerase
MQIIPAIDIIGGRCVRLIKGDYFTASTYPTDPREMVERFLQAGARHLHVVDLEGAKTGRVINWKTLEGVASVRGLDIQMGGGIRTAFDVERVLALCVSRVVVSSVAIKSPETLEHWATRFGPEKFCVALDLKNGSLMVDGWQTRGMQNLTSAVERMIDLGISRFLSTDIERDGTLSGPNLQLYRTLSQVYPDVQWVASGGVGSLSDIQALRETGVAGVVIGKALHDGLVKLEELFGEEC